jgi:hypothetical protein
VGSSRALVAAGALALVGCGIDVDPEVREVTAPFGSSVELVADDPAVLVSSEAQIDWVIDSAPDGSARRLIRTDDRVRLELDRHGTFVVDRWVRLATADSWTHRFYVDTLPVPPLARIAAPAEIAVGSRFTLDGSGSAGIDDAPLRYQWRLAARPRDSLAVIADRTAVETSVGADQPGRYEVELSVFDGVLWSTPDRAVIEAR